MIRAGRLELKKLNLRDIRPHYYQVLAPETSGKPFDRDVQHVRATIKLFSLKIAICTNLLQEDLFRVVVGIGEGSGRVSLIHF